MTWVIIERHTGRYLERTYPSGFICWTTDPDRARLFEDKRVATAIACHRVPLAADVVEAA